MHPRLFEIPLLEDGPPASWGAFAAAVAVVVAFMWLASFVAPKRKLVAQLMTILPLAAFLTVFIVFVKSPFGDTGTLPINAYGFSIMVGFLLASWVAVRRARPLGIKSDFILDVGIIAMIFGIIGAKINYLIQYSGESATEPDKLSIFSDMGVNPLGALLLGPVPLAFWWLRARDPQKPVQLYSWKTGVLFVLTLVFAVVGAWAFHLYQHRDEYSWKLFSDWQHGFVLYGGLIAGAGAGILYIKMRGQSLSTIADLAAAPMMLGVAFGRIGCFLNGCCYGVRTEGFPGVSFPKNSPAYSEQQNERLLEAMSEQSLPVHPTQLYEAAAAVLFFFILSWLWRRPRKARGEVFLVMMMLYATWRFIVEFVRGDAGREFIDPLSYSQAVSLAVLVVAGILLTYLRRKARETPPPAEPSEPPQAPPDPESKTPA